MLGYQCPSCDKVTKRKDNMRSHMTRCRYHRAKTPGIQPVITNVYNGQDCLDDYRAIIMSQTNGNNDIKTQHVAEDALEEGDPLLMFNFEEDFDCLGKEEEDAFEIDIISRDINDQIAIPKNIFNNVGTVVESQSKSQLMNLMS